jgi:hypothetical protein
MPETLNYNWNPIYFPGPVSIGGWANFELRLDGTAHWTSHMHVSFLPYDYSIAFVQLV